MSYGGAAYWQQQANDCTQYADEGACLARISRRAPVTIVPGLGQVDEIVTLAPRSQQLVALQTVLMNAGVLPIRTADGVISSNSPTLIAVRGWASSHRLATAGIARTSNSGLAIPSSTLASIMGGGAAPGGGSQATPSSGGGKSGGGATAPDPARPSATIPDLAPATPSWVMPTAVATTAAVLLGALAWRRGWF